MENNCTFLVTMPDKLQMPTLQEITTELESQDAQRKVGALKKAIMLTLAGEEMPRILMTVIRFCITSEDHTLQKLLMFYYESVRKYDAQGKLLPEMILVCNALRNNLVHPNEYIRGSTLRFLCKLREPEILEPLVSAIKQCLTHRHPYVRRNAVLTVYSIVRQFPDLYPDAMDDISRFMDEESDPGTRRNAFVMMFSTAQDKATIYLVRNLDRVLSFGDGFAQILLELIRKVARSDPGKKGPFLRIVFSLLESPSASVCYEAAGTLVSLSASPAAVKAAAAAYIKILNKESDNNVKLIILERLSAMKKRYVRVLRELIMDILRVLVTPALEVRRRALDVAMDLVSPRNVDEVMALLKKEIVATGSKNSASSAGAGASIDAEATAYRGMLITAIHGCAVRFPEVAPAVVQLLMDFLNGEGALSVIEFVREIVETFPEMRGSVMSKLRDVMPEIISSDVYRVALWILGQYSLSDADVHAALHEIRECIGPLPLAQPFGEYAVAQAAKSSAAAAAAAEANEGKEATAKSSKPVVLADGTYATQSAITETRKETTSSSSSSTTAGLPAGIDIDDVRVPILRRLLLAGDYYLAAVVASTTTKLALRVCELHGREDRKAKQVTVDAMLVMCSLLELGAGGMAGTPSLLPSQLMPAVSNRSYGGGFRVSSKPDDKSSSNSSHGVRIDQDSFERIVLCMRVLGDPAAHAATLPVLLKSCKDVFRHLLEDRRKRAAQAVKDGVASSHSLMALSHSSSSAHNSANEEKKYEGPVVQPDELLSIRQLRSTMKGGAGAASAYDDYDLALDDAAEMLKAAGTASEDFMSRLKRVHQLTGFTDPVYAEAVVRVHEFDILLDITLINRTQHTLTNVTVELSVMGDLKLVERPPVFTLGPKDSRQCKASIKVSSTETGHVFGNVVYNAPGTTEPAVINLAEIHVDIMDYIQPVPVSDASFRSMWSDFEWENKVTVNTNITSLHEFVRHIARHTNLRILTPIEQLPQSVPFLCANLYARSIFGEDALVNVSVETKQDGGIRGHIRIRAKTQGVALSIGDRLTAKQKA